MTPPHISRVITDFSDLHISFKNKFHPDKSCLLLIKILKNMSQFQNFKLMKTS